MGWFGFSRSSSCRSSSRISSRSCSSTSSNLVLGASKGLPPFIWPKNVTNEAFSVRSHIKNSSPPPCGVGWFWFSRGSNTSIALASRSSRSSSSSSSSGSSTSSRGGNPPPYHGGGVGNTGHGTIHTSVRMHTSLTGWTKSSRQTKSTNTGESMTVVPEIVKRRTEF